MFAPVRLAGVTGTEEFPNILGGKKHLDLLVIRCQEAVTGKERQKWSDVLGRTHGLT